MFKITKEFSFCYGHRVWTQKLKEEFCATGDSSCKCRHLHGHEGLVRVSLSAETLEQSMVTDFKHLGWLKNFLDDTLDHKFIIDKNDPMFESMVYIPFKQFTGHGLEYIMVVEVPKTTHRVGYTLDMVNLIYVDKTSPIYEVLEGFFIVDFVPTSEELARWLFNLVDAKMSKIGVTVDSVEWCETPKSSAIYTR